MKRRNAMINLPLSLNNDRKKTNPFNFKKYLPANIFQERIPVTRSFCFSALFLITLLVGFTSGVCAQGNLLITPRRVVFEGSKKIQELNLANIGKDSARYVLSMVEIRMKDDGSFERITEPDSGQLFASPYLRFFPRSVVLGPNESQLLKVQLSKTEQLKPGEYRSHVYFRAERDDKPLGEIEARVDSGSISVSLIPIFGITIPVIVRIGELSASVSISDVKIHKTDTAYAVGMMLHRAGNKSVYGNIKAEYISIDGKATEIGRANGVSVYTPNTKRYFEIKLQNTPLLNLKQGKLRIQYLSDSDYNQEKIAEFEINLDQ
ncbi:MAG: molecular chaperone [Bacteroidetes bacterium]|nr:molecular chaperone [Bacteroidota bacterium]